MSTEPPSWGSKPDDATAVRQPMPQAHEAALPPPAGSAGTSPSWESAEKTPVTPAGPGWADPAPTPPPRPVSQQHSAPVVAEPHSLRRDGTRAALLGALIAAIVLFAGGGGFYLSWSGKTSASSSPTTDFSGSLPAGGTSSSSSIPQSNSAPTTQAAPPVNLEAAALDQLDAMHSGSVARVSLDGRWVAQVASKSVGITDPLQTTQTGSHTFMAADILAESLEARRTVSDPDRNVYLLWGSDFGKRSQAPNGSPYWVTVVDTGFGSSTAVTTWCRTTYSSLTPAQLADTCAPRQLTPPHS